VDVVRFTHIGILAAWMLAFVCGPAAAVSPGVTIHTATGEFEDIRDRVVTAIEERGLVLNYTGHIATMLERTGKDLGRTQPIYGKAEVLEFCSAALSRATMEANPHNIVFCPYAIAVYTLPAQPGRVYVSYRKPPPSGVGPSVKALREVGKLLDQISREALK
jgi:uncharacterized protein (DUF302 family)